MHKKAVCPETQLKSFTLFSSLWVYPIKKKNKPVQTHPNCVTPPCNQFWDQTIAGEWVFSLFQKLYSDQFQAHASIGKVTRTIQLKEGRFKKKKKLVGPDFKSELKLKEKHKNENEHRN